MPAPLSGDELRNQLFPQDRSGGTQGGRVWGGHYEGHLTDFLLSTFQLGRECRNRRFLNLGIAKIVYKLRRVSESLLSMTLREPCPVHTGALGKQMARTRQVRRGVRCHCNALWPILEKWFHPTASHSHSFLSSGPSKHFVIGHQNIKTLQTLHTLGTAECQNIKFNPNHLQSSSSSKSKESPTSHIMITSVLPSMHHINHHHHGDDGDAGGGGNV